MRRKTHRLIAMMCVLCMLFTSMPISVYSDTIPATPTDLSPAVTEETIPEETIPEEEPAAEDGETPAAEPEEETAEGVPGETEDEPAEEPAGASEETTGEEQTEETGETPAETPADEQAEEPAETPAAEPEKETTEDSAETPEADPAAAEPEEEADAEPEPERVKADRDLKIGEKLTINGELATGGNGEYLVRFKPAKDQTMYLILTADKELTATVTDEDTGAETALVTDHTDEDGTVTLMTADYRAKHEGSYLVRIAGEAPATFSLRMVKKSIYDQEQAEAEEQTEEQNEEQTEEQNEEPAEAENEEPAEEQKEQPAEEAAEALNEEQSKEQTKEPAEQIPEEPAEEPEEVPAEEPAEESETEPAADDPEEKADAQEEDPGQTQDTTAPTDAEEKEDTEVPATPTDLEEKDGIPATQTDLEAAEPTEIRIEAVNSPVQASITFLSDAGIPQDAELQVRELTDEEQAAYQAETAQALNAENESYLRYTKYLAFSLTSNGEAIELNGPVSVSVTLPDVSEGADALQVGRFDNRTPVLLDSERTESTISFETDTFDVFGIGNALVAVTNHETELAKVEVLSFSETAPVSVAVAEDPEVIEGLEVLGTFTIEDNTATVPGTEEQEGLFIKAELKGDAELDPMEGVALYSVDENGQTDILMEELTEEAKITELEATQVAVIKDTGYRHLTLTVNPDETTEDQTVTLDGMMPKDAEAAIEDVTAAHAAENDMELSEENYTAETADNSAETAADDIRLNAATADNADPERTEEKPEETPNEKAEEVKEEAAEEDTAEAEAEANEGSKPKLIAAYDITILNGTEEYQPDAEHPITVEICDSRITVEDGKNIEVWHIRDDGTQEQIEDYTVENGRISFNSYGFSIYTIVEGPTGKYDGSGWVTALSLKTIMEYGSQGFYLEHNGYYFDGGTANSINGNGNRHGLTGTTEQYNSSVPNEAAKFYFIPYTNAEDNNQFYITGPNGDYVKLTYINNDQAGLDYVDNQNSATVFTLEQITESGKIKFKIFGVANNKTYYWNRNIKGSGAGVGAFVGYKDRNDNNVAKISPHYYKEPVNDPYKLDGKSYGLMYYNGSGTTATAQMAVQKNTSTLATKDIYVRSDPMNQSRKLFVAKDSDISFWTFTCIEEDKYYLTNEGQYLRIDNANITLTDTPDEYCVIQVDPGTGTNKGKIRLIGTQSQKAAKLGGGAQAIANATWYNLADHSVYSEEDFVSRSAYKVSVSDLDNVPSGKEVIIYTRVWNENDKKYEFYAIDHNGDLVPCYQLGDSIDWIGTKFNTLLWEITDLPNNYYQLQNTYNGKYLTPHIVDEGSSVFTTDDDAENNRINLGGRQHYDYYTTILRWDDPHYDYACIRSNSDKTKIVSGRMAQAEQFFFAIMDPPIVGSLTEVPTVDFNNTKVGVTDSEQLRVMGTSEFTENAAQPKLLSDYLDPDTGYPTATITGRSLGELFAGGSTVNHLFIESIYDTSGYFHFDSTENFAHLNGSSFTVYQELGTVSGEGVTRQHGQFMPYNMIDKSHISEKNPKNLTDILAKSLPESDPSKYEPLYAFTEVEDYHFGMEISGTFMQTPNGLDAWGHDLIFDFVGDDDFWLYVDDQLVIDLGGIHKALRGRVNYSTGKVINNGVETRLYDIFEEHYRTANTEATDAEVEAYLNGIFRDNGKTVKINGVDMPQLVFKDYSSHTVRIFYMERGAGASNLRMRFNLTTVTPGQVFLGKKVTGTDKDEYASVQYPFQILYRTQGSSAYTTWGQNQAEQEAVTYRNTNNPVNYLPTYEVGGYTYKDVFFLRPEQYASIQFPDNLDDYYIRECGIDTNIYDNVKANEEDVTGISPAALCSDNAPGISQTTGGTIVPTSKCYETSVAQVKDRTEVVFSNNVQEQYLHTLTIKKVLWANENGTVRQLSRAEDSTGFLMRVYLGKNDNGTYEYYDTGEYFVKDPGNNYCRFVVGNGFTSLGKTDFSQLTSDEKTSATFYTSPSGAVDKIPAGYSIEIRDLMEGTWFKVVEEDYDIPVGYGKRNWQGTETIGSNIQSKNYSGYCRIAGSYELDGNAENAGKITAILNGGIDATMEVHNIRGYGLRANKVWSDKDFISRHGDIYFAVFIGDSTTPVLNTIHRIDTYNTTRYFFESLESGATFADYHVYEVDVTNPVCDANGYVTSYDSISIHQPTDPAFGLTGNIPKNGTTPETNYYRVSYNQGTPSKSDGSSVDNIRTDTVTNTASGGLLILKTRMDGTTGIKGAVFELYRENGTRVDRYTSDNAGLVTTLYVENGTYTLKETKVPSGFQETTGDLTITVDGDNYTVTDKNGNYSGYDSNTKTLTIKNKPYTLQAIKVQYGGSKQPLAGAHFSLYRQIEGVRDYYPMEGFEDLVTQENGVIPNIDENLPAGGYYLVETQAPPGYTILAYDIVITIDPYNPSNVITIDQQHDDLKWLEEIETDDDVAYIIRVPNPPDDHDLETVVAPTDYASRHTPFLLLLLFGVLLILFTGAWKYRSKLFSWHHMSPHTDISVNDNVPKHTARGDPTNISDEYDQKYSAGYSSEIRLTPDSVWVKDTTTRGTPCPQISSIYGMRTKCGRRSQSPTSPPCPRATLWPQNLTGTQGPPGQRKRGDPGG